VVFLDVEAGDGVEMKQSISWSRAMVDFEIGVGAERVRGMRRMREGCLTRLARSMQHDSTVGSLGSWELFVRNDKEIRPLKTEWVQFERSIEVRSLIFLSAHLQS
jgi:hypothetical protein